MTCSDSIPCFRRAAIRPAIGRAIVRFAVQVGAAVLVGAALFVLGAAEAKAQGSRRPQYELKIATLAPEGSTWMNIMGELDAEVRQRTGNAVGLRFYPGGIQGDELVVLRKIRTGQLHGGGFTGVGLGEIAPGLRVLELPFLLRDEAEVDAVHARMDPTFDRMLGDAGYTLLGWAEVGFVYVYSKEPVASIRDLQRQRVWLWEGDPLAEAFLREAGIAPVPLAITDVLTSLQTGLITTVYISPLANIALQWFTRISYVTDVPLTYSIGAVVVTTPAYERIPAEHRGTVRELCEKHFGRLRRATVEDNRKSQEVIARAGVRTITPPQAEVEEFLKIGERVRGRLVGKLFDQTVLDQVLSAVQEHRQSAARSAGAPR